MKNGSSRRVIFQPHTHDNMQRGFNQIVDALSPTLGPASRMVAVEKTSRKISPEILDNGGVIARRIVQLNHPDQDMGAMFLRHVLWSLYTGAGDGTATAAVMFKAIFDEALRFLSAGGNAMRVRRYLEEGLGLLLEEIDRMTMPVQGKDQLAKFAESVCYDASLARILGEVFDIIGEYGILEVRNDRIRHIEKEYLVGAYWRSGGFAPDMLVGKAGLRAEMLDAAILLTDFEIQDPQALIPVLDMSVQSGAKNLLIVARSASDRALGLFRAASREPGKFRVLGVKLPGLNTTDQANILDDLSVLTGGTPLIGAKGDTWASFRIEMLGGARKVWVEKDYFGIVRGQGDPRELRSHLSSLRNAYGRESDEKDRDKIRERIGKLMGGAATLKIGGATEAEIKTQTEKSERTAKAVRGVIRDGVVPGGGAAFLACHAAIRRRLQESHNIEERAAFRALETGLSAPFRTILTNAGYDPSKALAAISLDEHADGFDVVSGQPANMIAAGILDAAATQKAILRAAISGAALALTTDVLVHVKKPIQSVEP